MLAASAVAGEIIGRQRSELDAAAINRAVGVRLAERFAVYNVADESVHWGHEGSVADMAAALTEICGRAFREGEYAPHRAPRAEVFGADGRRIRVSIPQD